MNSKLNFVKQFLSERNLNVLMQTLKNHVILIILGSISDKLNFDNHKIYIFVYFNIA